MRRLSALLATGVLVALVALALSSCGGGASGGGEHQQAKIRGCVPECLYQGTGLRPFVVDRNIRHFVWYGGVAGEGLRSVGEEAKLSPHPRACALSCPSSAIYGPGYPSGYLGFMFGVRAAGPHIREATKPGKLESVRRHSYL